MRITLTNMIKEATFDVSKDMSIGDVLALCASDLWGDGAYETTHVTKDGIPLVMTTEHLSLTLDQLGVKENDVLMVARSRTTTQLTPELTAAVSNIVKSLGSVGQSSSTNSKKTTLSSVLPSADANSKNNNMDQGLAALIKSIKVPNVRRASEERNVREHARIMFTKMADPSLRGEIYFLARPLFDQYMSNPNDFETFVKVYEKQLKDDMEKQRMMADPDNAEGQRLIQEQIQLENINYSYAQALEHTPEAYIPVHMLYIRMEINGHPVKAFVDSGAQVSIMSEACTRRCELAHMIDKRFTGTARGVGGLQKFVGKIHSCQVKVEDHFFPCNFDVLADRDMDLLLGLNILKRHQCNINLKQNRLEMGDGTITPFLSDADVNAHLEDIAGQGTSEAIYEADSVKLAEIISMGFSEKDASEALKLTRNDLELAVSHLFTKMEPDVMDSK